MGLQGSGKTELCHALCGLPRTEHTSTLGVCVYDLEIPTVHIRLTEIGGADNLIDIWKYYYSDSMGVIYVLSTNRSSETYNRNAELIKSLLSKSFLNGKPFLIVGTFQDDTENSFNLIEFTYAYDFENYAQTVRTPIYVDVCDKNTYKTMKKGLNWMVTSIESNYHGILNRILFDKKVSKIEMDLEGQFGGLGLRPTTAPPVFVKKRLDRSNSVGDKRGDEVESGQQSIE